MNKITNKVFRGLQSWLDDQAMGDEISIVIWHDGKPIKGFTMNIVTNDYKEHQLTDIPSEGKWVYTDGCSTCGD